MTGVAHAELVASAASLRAVLGGTTPWILDLRIVAVGWATVELERAAGELGDELCGRWLPAPRDALIGARAWACDPVAERPVRPILLEPDTEGRLAATLARFGEGLAAIYLEASSGGAPVGALSAAAAGPLGEGRLVLGGPRWGPSAIILEPSVRAP